MTFLQTIAAVVRAVAGMVATVVVAVAANAYIGGLGGDMEQLEGITQGAVGAPGGRE